MNQPNTSHGSSNPRVTIIITSYNYAQYLNQAVASALAQTYKNIEIIISDNGSTDASREMIKGLQRQHPHIISSVFSDRGRAVAIARNEGLKLARGDLINFLDADDILLDHKIAAQVAQFEKTSKIGVRFSETWVSDADLKRYFLFSCLGGVSGSDFRSTLIQRNVIAIHSALIPRCYFEEFGFFDEALHIVDDWEWFLRVSKKVHFYFDPEPGVLYRRHRQNITFEAREGLKAKDEVSKPMLMEMNMLEKILRQNELYEFSKTQREELALRLLKHCAMANDRRRFLPHARILSLNIRGLAFLALAFLVPHRVIRYLSQCRRRYIPSHEETMFARMNETKSSA